LKYFGKAFHFNLRLCGFWMAWLVDFQGHIANDIHLAFDINGFQILYKIVMCFLYKFFANDINYIYKHVLWISQSTTSAGNRLSSSCKYHPLRNNNRFF
jgi:hypothetical protein